MAQITADTIRRLFDETAHKTWPGFRATLMRYKEGKAQGIPPAVIDELLEFTTRTERMNETFPISAEQLLHAMERRHEKVTA
ncbi:MAG: hypothetical protein K6V36_12625 [Anaerolineae bacterium]|nr:hypothetical protein [Anaerolineae bacterium]